MAQNNKTGKITLQCSCGNKFETWNHSFESPYDYMCPECNKKDAWYFATRMLRLEKFRCVKCGWKLKEKDCINIEEHTIEFRCKCCGYPTILWFPEPDYYDY